MKGLTQHKKRNASQNERRVVWNAFQATAAKIYEIKRVYRENLLTGEITESSRSKMNSDVRFWFETFKPLKTVYALPQSVAWEALERGAVLYTDNAKFWIENNRTVPPVKPEPQTKLCKSGGCNRYDNPAVKDDLCIECYERQIIEWTEPA